MRRVLYFLFFATAAFADEEIAAVDHLIASTQKHLSIQHSLKEKMIQFNDQKERFILGEQSKQHATKMVHTAKEILKIIKDEKLQYLFSSQYLEELALFSSIAEKNKPSRP